MTDPVKVKIVLDPLHGVIELDPLAVKIIDTKEFQRLRFVKQLGCTDYVYPGATHTRFVHSIGVYHLACKLTESLKRWLPDNIKLMAWEEECIRIAALCHDLGHGPFCHLYEEICRENVKQNWRWDHQDMSCLLVRRIFREKEIRSHLMNGDKSICLILRLIMGKKILDMTEEEKRKAYIFQIVSNKENTIDVDKWDCLCRDAMFCGMKEGFLSERAISGARVVQTLFEGTPVNQIGYPEKDYMMLHNMLQTRHILHRYIYQHRVVISMNIMVKDIIKAAQLDAITKGSSVFQFKLIPESQSNKIPDSDAALDDLIKNSLTADGEKLTEDYIRLTDDIISRIRYISKRNGYSQKVPIAYAIRLLQRIDERQFYEMHREIHLKHGMKHQEALAVKTACVKELEENLAKEYKFSECLAVELICFNFGMEDENPMAKVIFYNKRTPDTGLYRGRVLPKNKVSHLLSEVFSDYYIRIYCKEHDIAEIIKQTVDKLVHTYDIGSKEDSEEAAKGAADTAGSRENLSPST